MSGRSVAAALARRFGRMPVAAFRKLAGRVRSESLDLGVTYQPERRRVEVTDMVLVPVVLDPADVAAVRSVAATMAGIARRLPAWRERIPAVRAILPLEPAEEDWILDCRLAENARTHAILGRWDMNVELLPSGARKIRLFEGNGVAIGGLNYAPASERIATGIARDLLGGEPGRTGGVGPLGDLHGSLFGFFRAHAARVGRPFRSVAWLEDKTWDSGITEAPYVLAALERRGIRALFADPRDLRVVRGEVRHGDDVVDVIYRNIELRDLAALERSHGRLDALRLACRRDQVVSSLAGEMDHKSLFEVLTLPEVRRRLSAAERATVRACVPWTRLLCARRCDGPDGRSVDLPEYARGHRARLVLKPNRACGGEGVTIGPAVSRTVWERTLREAMRREGTWVVQAHIRPDRVPFPIERRGRVAVERRFANLGVIVLPGGTGILGRASASPVVNVSRGGGILPVVRSGRWPAQ